MSDLSEQLDGYADEEAIRDDLQLIRRFYEAEKWQGLVKSMVAVSGIPRQTMSLLLNDPDHKEFGINAKRIRSLADHIRKNPERFAATPFHADPTQLMRRATECSATWNHQLTIYHATVAIDHAILRRDKRLGALLSSYAYFLNRNGSESDIEVGLWNTIWRHCDREQPRAVFATDAERLRFVAHLACLLNEGGQHNSAIELFDSTVFEIESEDCGWELEKATLLRNVSHAHTWNNDPIRGRKFVGLARQAVTPSLRNDLSCCNTEIEAALVDNHLPSWTDVERIHALCKRILNGSRIDIPAGCSIPHTAGALFYTTVVGAKLGILADEELEEPISLLRSFYESPHTVRLGTLNTFDKCNVHPLSEMFARYAKPPLSSGSLSIVRRVITWATAV